MLSSKVSVNWAKTVGWGLTFLTVAEKNKSDFIIEFCKVVARTVHLLWNLTVHTVSIQNPLKQSGTRHDMTVPKINKPNNKTNSEVS